MCVMLGTSDGASVVDAQAEVPEGGAHLSKGAMVPRLASQPQCLNDVAKTTELAKGIAVFSP